ncbi:MAG: hypothetical protein QF410_09980, partial [Planctomycetota bacterium]|nr:hypothetical protein [Planctomycetota bacterium]
MDAFRLRGLLECSLLVVAFALVPYVLGRTPLGEATSWRVSSVLFLVSGILAIRSTLMRRRVIADIPASSWIRLTIFALYLAPPPALFLVAIGLFEIWGPAVYLVCLLSYLLAEGIGFFRVMVSFI